MSALWVPLWYVAEKAFAGHVAEACKSLHEVGAVLRRCDCSAGPYVCTVTCRALVSTDALADLIGLRGDDYVSRHLSMLLHDLAASTGRELAVM